MKKIDSVAFIGSGNVATRLAIEFMKQGICIVGIYSRSFDNAKTLSEQVNSIAIKNLNDIPEADLYIISITDDAIADILDEVKISERIIVHTSGTTDLKVFGSNFKNYGVFYPLQTFQKNRDVNFKEIPICIEGCNAEIEDSLLMLAKRLSPKTFLISSEQRKALHVAAVFACNFTNYMYAISQEILEKENIPFKIVEPLIIETANKITQIKPKDAQTGPALRNDIKTLEKHQEYLSNFPEYKKLYNFVSEKIHKQLNKR